MIENPAVVRHGSTFVRDGEEVTIVDVGNDIQTKAPGDANWHHAVIYRSVNEDTRRVRTLNDFCQKFDLLEPIPSEEDEEDK